MKLNSALHFVGIQVLVKANSEVVNLNTQQNDFGHRVAKFFDDKNYLPYSTIVWGVFRTTCAIALSFTTRMVMEIYALGRVEDSAVQDELK